MSPSDRAATLIVLLPSENEKALLAAAEIKRQLKLLRAAGPLFHCVRGKTSDTFFVWFDIDYFALVLLQLLLMQSS